MPGPQIRALAICLFLVEDRLLVNEAHDPVKGMSFCRPLDSFGPDLRLVPDGLVELLRSNGRDAFS
jgi:hypothetical protein